MSALPRSCVPVPKIEQDCYDWYARHADKTAWVQANRAEVVFIGDSLTHFWEGGPADHDYGEGLWSESFAGRPVLNLGYGYDRTQNVLWRLEHGELAGQTPKLIVLNIGTNHCSISPNYDGDTPEVAVTGVAAVVAKLHEMCPEARLMVMALFPRGGKLPFISAANALLREKAAAWEFADLVDLTRRLGDAQGEPVARFYRPDLCHLCRAGYEIWLDAIAPYLARYAGIYAGRVRAAQGDITRMAVDAIVNAANRTLLGGGGVDGAIHRAAGPELLAECRTLNGCATGEAKLTRGYRLPAKYVIHTVGPVYGNRPSDPELLAACYRNSLDVALAHGDIRSIAFPAISTGVYGYPAPAAAEIAVRTVRAWSAAHPEANITVTLVAFSPAAFELYRKELERP